MEAGKAKLVAESSCMKLPDIAGTSNHQNCRGATVRLILMPTSKLTDPKGHLSFSSEREHPCRKHSALKRTLSREVSGYAPHHCAKSRDRAAILSARLPP